MARKNPRLGPSDSSDTYADRPDRPATDSDEGGTGERLTVGKIPHAKDEGADRVVNSEEAGLGGGLDQAEEAQLGITDEERARKRKP
jgi:hypothetical protein